MVSVVRVPYDLGDLKKGLYDRMPQKPLGAKAKASSVESVAIGAIVPGVVSVDGSAPVKVTPVGHRPCRPLPVYDMSVAAISAAADSAVFVEPQDNFDSALVNLSIDCQNWGPLLGFTNQKAPQCG